MYQVGNMADGGHAAEDEFREAHDDCRRDPLPGVVEPCVDHLRLSGVVPVGVLSDLGGAEGSRAEGLRITELPGQNSLKDPIIGPPGGRQAAGN